MFESVAFSRAVRRLYEGVGKPGERRGRISSIWETITSRVEPEGEIASQAGRGEDGCRRKRKTILEDARTRRQKKRGRGREEERESQQSESWKRRRQRRRGETRRVRGETSEPEEKQKAGNDGGKMEEKKKRNQKEIRSQSDEPVT